MQIPQGLPTTAGSVPSSLEYLGLDMKSLVKKIQDLTHLGIEDSNIALPKICVVGDQSTGKSSLIEGISEIKVPRSSGTCTRCPLEINLSESEPGQGWRCSVYLVRRYQYQSSKRKMTYVPKRSDSLGPWEPKSDVVSDLFVSLTDRREVQDAIKWAQLAILNPTSEFEDYVPGRNARTSQESQVKFSPNVVRLDITAPNFPALSFYDLPGVISQAEHDHETYLVQLVENLVRRYVTENNCIVLLALTMTDDPTNSSAARIVRDIKGAKARTLGVLTKPDRLSSYESFEQWGEILEGKKFNLGHGYFVVRNNPDPDVEHAQARQEEEKFFGEPFWSGNLATFQHRFGTRHLQSALSTVLMEQIQKCLPSIISQINARAEDVDGQLKELPGPPIENVQRVLIEKITTLGLKLDAMFEGGTGRGSSANTLQIDWNRIVTDFQKALAKTRPTLRMISDSDIIFLAPKYDPDCDMIIVSSTNKNKRKAPTSDPKTPESNSPTKGNDALPARTNGPDYQTEVFTRWKDPGRRFSLEEVRKFKEESHRAGIPNQIDPSAVETLNRESVKHWKGLMIAFVDAVHDAVQRVLSSTLNDVVGQYHQTKLYRELLRIIDAFLQQLRANFHAVGKDHYRIEHEKPFTMAQTQHREAMQIALHNLINSRAQSRNRCYWKARGYSDEDDVKLSKNPPEDIGADPFAQEIEMMAVSPFHNVKLLTHCALD